MKRLLSVCLVVFLLGCSSSDNTDPAIRLRERLLASSGCTFTAHVTADYGDKHCNFSLDCKMDATGNIAFTVVQPETIKGISGTISAEGGALTFDDQVLAFQLLADGQVTPVSAPYLLIKTLRGGYIQGYGEDGEYQKLQINDSYHDNALSLDIWLDENDVPICADILYKGRRFLSLEIEEFIIL